MNFLCLATNLNFKNDLSITLQHQMNVHETVGDSTAFSIWPGSILLSLFLQCSLSLNNSYTILELGAGLGLTALVTIESFNVKKYILQEWPDQAIICALQHNLAKINIEKYKIIQGKWGDYELNQNLIEIKEIDYFVFSDCFYDKKSFPELLSTISFVSNQINARIFCIYHHRNVNDSIISYLNMFNLDAKIVEKNSSLNAAIEEFKSLNQSLQNGTLLNFQDLYIIEFTRKIH